MSLSVFITNVFDNIKSSLPFHSTRAIIRGINKTYHKPKYALIVEFYNYLKEHQNDVIENDTDYVIGLIIGANFTNVTGEANGQKTLYMEFYRHITKVLGYPAERLYKFTTSDDKKSNVIFIDLVKIMKLMLHNFKPIYNSYAYEELPKLMLDYVKVDDDDECVNQ